MKMDVGELPYFEHITKHFKQGTKIGCDPGQIPTGSFQARSKYFKEKGFEMCTLKENLVDQVWEKQGRPERPVNKVFVHDVKYNGKSVN